MLRLAAAVAVTVCMRRKVRVHGEWNDHNNRFVQRTKEDSSVAATSCMAVTAGNAATAAMARWPSLHYKKGGGGEGMRWG